MLCVGVKQIQSPLPKATFPSYSWVTTKWLPSLVGVYPPIKTDKQYHSPPTVTKHFQPWKKMSIAISHCEWEGPYEAFLGQGFPPPHISSALTNSIWWKFSKWFRRCEFPLSSDGRCWLCDGQEHRAPGLLEMRTEQGNSFPSSSASQRILHNLIMYPANLPSNMAFKNALPKHFREVLAF